MPYDPARSWQPESDEVAEWYLKTPWERWEASGLLWEFYLSTGGSLDPETDSQSPFHLFREPRPIPANGGTGLRVIRRDC